MASGAARYDALPVADYGTSKEAGCIRIPVKPGRAVVRYVDTAFEFRTGRLVAAGRSLRRGLAMEGRFQDRLPKSDTVAPRIGQNGPAQADATARQGADLRVCVELRGFEPLTPSMRTRCATGLRYSPENLS